MLLGVDVGGTFTDAVLVDDEGIFSAKAPTTPEDQSEGVIEAITKVLGLSGRPAADIGSFAHGMTVATNALLEGRGARAALVATAGFTDIVELGRQARPELYRLCAAGPAPLVPPELRVAARERCGPDGVIEPLTDEAAAQLADEVAALAPESVAVCLLHSYRHPEHERRVGEALRKRLPQTHLSLSHELIGTFREYERAATTEIDAALSPLLSQYLRRLGRRSADAELPEPQIMQSSGGLADLKDAAAHAATTVLSGPAGGAAAAALLARRIGEPDLICLDMGGTSCDVSVVRDGRVQDSEGREVAGRMIALPMVDIHTVGAGGGSIAWRDAGGALRVGPASAGSVPGPACYGRGGTLPTVTDANLVLGRLPGVLEELELDLAGAGRAIGALAAELGLSLVECAAGIVRVANAEMVRAIRVMTVERGLDPRDFTLLAFGGAGPLHACELATELGIVRIAVPGQAGVLSALGLAAADRRRDHARTVMLEEFGDAELRALATGDETVWHARYRGQSHELALHDVAPIAEELREAFHAEHGRRYGYRDQAAVVELVTVRSALVEPGPDVQLREAATAAAVAGPHVLPLTGCTLFVADGWRAELDDTGTWRLRWTP